MVRYEDDMSAEDMACLLVVGLTGPEKRSLLRHPSWDARCACGQYGRPYGAHLRLLDFDTIHETDLCQPRREYIEAP